VLSVQLKDTAEVEIIGPVSLILWNEREPADVIHYKLIGFCLFID
jgi:hypothetical protein